MTPKIHKQACSKSDDNTDAQGRTPTLFIVRVLAELVEKPAFSNTTRTAGAISSTFIFTETAALYIMMDARQRSATSKPAGQLHDVMKQCFKGA